MILDLQDSGAEAPSPSFVKKAVGLLRRLRPRHARYALLGITVALSDLLFRLPILKKRKHRTRLKLDWRTGLSIVVPHRHGVEMLDQCLAHLSVAMDRVQEPVEVIVVVNGSAMAEYAMLKACYSNVRWFFFPEPLGFTSAVLKGIAEARHGATYLLNDDMLLEPEALETALSWRGPQVFAVASQIFFQERGRRREETGWTSMTIVNGLPLPRHETPLGPTARGAVWAGAGSALFHAELLRELMPGCLPFDPFYWEDVDLGVRAWRLGYDSLLCPTSVAWHKHRATVEKFYPAEEVARIVERNRLLFQLRNPFPRQRLQTTLQHIARVDRKTLGELGSWQSCLDLWRVRWRAFHAPQRDMDYSAMWTRNYDRPARPAIVLVSPFVVMPPTHGGAVRILRLAAELAKDFDVILVSDEGELYGTPGNKGRTPFSTIHLVGDRQGEPAGQETSRIARIQSHSRSALKDELCRVIDLYQPVAVLMEYMELGGLIDISPTHRPKYILILHDVLLSSADPSQADADRFEAELIDRFDGLVVSSPEDQELLGDRASCLVPNGYDLELAQHYTPSRGKRSILFVGPFRVPINWQGIRDFTEKIYPQVGAAVPGVSLTILGGKGARQMASLQACFDNPSIEILEYVEDILPLLQDCALTINPQAELRGSSIKVIESLAAGRVCVSTIAGARGRLASNFRGLVAVERLEDFATPVIQLLTDEDDRVVRETPEPDKLAAYSWEAAGDELRTYLRSVIESTP